jgi:hypothetical protein
MPVGRHARGIALGAFGACAALVAHGGPALLADPRWALPATLAAATAGWMVLGVQRIAGRGRAPRAASPATTAVTLLAAQLVAHLALGLAGVAPVVGQPGSLALHVLLGLVAAAAFCAWERAIGERVDAALRALLERLARVGRSRPPAVESPRLRPVLRLGRGRAPPLTT